MNIEKTERTILHVVWSTRDWEPHLRNETVRNKLFTFLQSRDSLYGVNIEQINGGHEHVHCLFLNTTNEDAKKIIRTMRKDANIWLKEKGYPECKWDNDFLVLPVTDDDLNDVSLYIKDQTSYHEQYSFAHEYDLLLSSYWIAK
ncbi:transposase [Bacteroides sp. 519]|uniref:transposase n=1 Tax=Bacteroides sp. 519 TaxID=2302937 RepID=UPI0013D73B9F|nr:transposase [Bacteroides sp. 519]NDV60421.1 hypothetical protein [Bacteroides sp. 519]